MTIGVAIPCHGSHTNYLQSLLNRLSEGTIVPDQVSISISGVLSPPELEFNGVLLIDFTPLRRSPAANRNIAASKLTTDIISFFDADDIPLPVRTEHIINAFEEGASCVVHDYFNLGDLVLDVSEYRFIPGLICKTKHDLHFPVDKDGNVRRIHCAHSSILRDLFNRFKFDESESSIYIEDSLFLRSIVEAGIAIGYLDNKLSIYVK